MSTAITRPTRVKRQPLRNKDKVVFFHIQVELNLELIEKLENNKVIDCYRLGAQDTWKCYQFQCQAISSVY